MIYPVFIIFLFNLLLICNCFVYDVQNSFKVRKNGNSASNHFGYSLDLAKENGKVWVVVGSPKDGVPVSGSFNSCPIYSQGPDELSCQTHPPNLSGAEIDGQKDIFDDQLLGVSVLTVTPPGSQTSEVWACAPRFQRPREKKWSTGKVENYALMLGNCFVYSGRDEFASNKRVIPLESYNPVFFGRRNLENEYAYGTVYSELGMSIHFDQDSRNVLYGAPGAWNWTGTFVVTDTEGKNPIRTQPWADWTPALNDYCGYSITSGKVWPKSTRPRQYVIGAPRAGPNRTGSIFVVDYEGVEDIKKVITMSGRQSGEYFGAAVGTVDLNGDGIEEIIVGSPLFSNNQGNNRISEKGFDEGRISIYSLRSSTQTIEEEVSIFGQKNGGRFGQALMPLGDLDGDGFGDFAVGSPYEKKGRGAISIFFGKANILEIQAPLQVIEADEIDSRFRGFGISFSNSKIDVDSNSLADLAVGAHLSGSAAVLRRKPVVTVSMKIKASIQSMSTSEPQEFTLTVCLTLKSKQSSSSSLKCLLQMAADLRTVFVEKDSGQLKTNVIDLPLDLIQGPEKCIEVSKVRMKTNYNPSIVEPPLSFGAELSPRSISGSKFDGQEGVLDPRVKNSQNLSIPFKTVCGTDNICTFDMSVEADSIDSPFVIGSSQSIVQTIRVRNLGGEPAYQPILKISKPKELGITKLPNGCNFKEGDVITCDVPGPLKPLQVEPIVVTYDSSKLIGGTKVLKWSNIEVFSNSPESSSKDTDPGNNNVNYQLELRTEADLEITSSENDFKVYKQGEIYRTVPFSQTFQIRNSLSSPIENVQAKVDIPTHFGPLRKEFIKVTSVVLSFPGQTEKFRCALDTKTQRQGTQQMKKDDHLDMSCNSAEIQCSTYKCPEFLLGGFSSSSLALLDVQLEFAADQLEQELGDDEVIFASEGHVQLPQNLEAELEPLNEKQDNVLSRIKFISQKTSLASVNKWFIIGAVLGAVVILIIILLFLAKCKCFQRKKPEEQDPPENKDEFEHLNQTQEKTEG